MSQATVDLYRELAEAYEERGQPAIRERFLVLAADAAYSAGDADEAERLRQKLLQGNPHHMLKPYSSYAQALEAAAIQIYVQDLRTNYPLAMTRKLLQSLREDGPEEQQEQNQTEVPPTAPFLDAKGKPTVPLGDDNDPLTFFGIDEEVEAPPPVVPLRPTSLHPPRRVADLGPAPPTAPLPSAPRAPLAPAAPAVPPPPPPSPVLLPRTVAPVDPFEPPEPAEPELPAGAWLTLLLFGMTLTAGVALAVYTLARPFLPREWLP